MSEREAEQTEARGAGAGSEQPPVAATRPVDGADVAAEAPVVTEDQVKSVLRRVKDPELNLNIMDLGLVYGISIEGKSVSVDMSLTSPACPSGPEIMTQAEELLRSLPGVEDVAVNLVWTPFWTPDRIEPRIRAYLGI
jgi:metal-sulfur cluster biosynthetic enzyme